MKATNAIESMQGLMITEITSNKFMLFQISDGYENRNYDSNNNKLQEPSSGVNFINIIRTKYFVQMSFF